MTIPAGRITRLFGTDGGVMLSLYPAFPEDFDTDTPLVVTIDGLDVPLYCDRFERRLGRRRSLRRLRHRTARTGAARARIPHRHGGRGGRRVLPRGPHRIRGRGRGGGIGGEALRNPRGLLRQRPQPALRAGDRRTTGARARRRGVYRTHRFRRAHGAPRAARGTARPAMTWHTW